MFKDGKDYDVKLKGGWNKGLPRLYKSGKEPTATTNGILNVELKKQYGPTAVYHLRKYGHLNNIGRPAGAIKGSTNARRIIIEGKSISEWSRELGVSRGRAKRWFEVHGTMKGCVPGKAGQNGGWNKKEEKKALLSPEERKAKRIEVGKMVMACPERRKIKSIQFKKSIKDLDAKGKEWRQKGSKNRKPVATPYGEYPSALTAAKLIGPKLGVKPCTIQSYIIRTSEKYKDWYYIEETA